MMVQLGNLTVGHTLTTRLTALTASVSQLEVTRSLTQEASTVNATMYVS